MHAHGCCDVTPNGDYCYDTQHPIGHGYESVVYPGHHIASGKEVAIKALSSRGGSGEVAIRNKLGYHPSLVDWYSVQRTADGQLFIVMQHCGINLKEHLKRHGAMSEQDARTVLTQLLQGVQHCHKLGVAHMDIGLSNVCISGSQAVLVDFGAARVIPLQEDADKTEYGTWSARPRHGAFGAPEFKAGGEYDHRASDLWSCGAVLHACLTGGLPPTVTPAASGAGHPSVTVFTAAAHEVSKSAREVVTAMVAADPTARPRLHTLLEHPWFKDVAAVSDGAPAAKAAASNDSRDDGGGGCGGGAGGGAGAGATAAGSQPNGHKPSSVASAGASVVAAGAEEGEVASDGDGGDEQRQRQSRRDERRGRGQRESRHSSHRRGRGRRRRSRSSSSRSSSSRSSSRHRKRSRSRSPHRHHRRHRRHRSRDGGRRSSRR